MEFLFRKNPDLPQLAWCARFRPGYAQVEVEHGPSVETCGDFFCEGAWNGDFSAEAYLEASVVSGTGAALSGNKTYLMPGSDRLSPLFSIENQSGIYVSNSAFYALASADEHLNEWYPFYFYDFLSYWRMGLHNPAGTIRLASGRNLKVHFFTRLVLEEDGKISFQPYPSGPKPDSFESYQSILLDGVKKVFSNASDPKRTKVLRPLAAMSRGYDSSATGSLAAMAGCKEAYTYFDSRSEKKDGDSAKANAERLGMECREYDRWEHTKMPEVNDAEFAMMGMAALTPLAALGETLQDRLLVTGDFGESIWGLVESGNCGELTLPWGRFLGGFGHLEFRLRTGFHLLAPSCIAVRHNREIHRIALSKEMKPWWLENSYNRPIPRRIAEEAGLPRDQFGMNKYASSHSTYENGRGFSPEGHQAYLGYISSRDSRGGGWKQRYWKIRFEICQALWRRFSSEKRIYKPFSWWRRYVPYLFNTIPRVNVWTYQFTFQWSEQTLRSRYLPNGTGEDATKEDSRHWAEYAYQLPKFQERLARVKVQIGEALRECPEGSLKIINLCSGDGRDLLDILPDHPRRDDTTSFLIDSSPEAIADAMEAAKVASLENRVKCVCGDAALLEHCADFVPANLVIVSGVFTHLAAEDAGKLVAALPMLCAPKAFVLWNRREGTNAYGLSIEELRECFRANGFVPVKESSSGPEGFLVVRERFDGTPKPWIAGPPVFKFFNHPPVASGKSFW